MELFKFLEALKEYTTSVRKEIGLYGTYKHTIKVDLINLIDDMVGTGEIDLEEIPKVNDLIKEKLNE